MGQSNYVHIDNCRIVAETEKAFLVDVPEAGEIWIPRSQVADPDDLNVGDSGRTVSVSEWFAFTKGLDGNE
jgi:hypothetical protein